LTGDLRTRKKHSPICKKIRGTESPAQGKLTHGHKDYGGSTSFRREEDTASTLLANDFIGRNSPRLRGKKSVPKGWGGGKYHRIEKKKGRESRGGPKHWPVKGKRTISPPEGRKMPSINAAKGH